MNGSNAPYSDDQAKAILRRAIEIDAENEAIFAPELLKELTLPFGLVSLLGLFSALAPRMMRSTRASMRIDLDGVRYRSGNKDQLLKWESVIQLAPGLPGAIKLVTPRETVMVMLQDFGDPDAVLAVIRARVAKATGVLPPGK